MIFKKQLMPSIAKVARINILNHNQNGYVELIAKFDIRYLIKPQNSRIRNISFDLTFVMEVFPKEKENSSAQKY
jgi:hypothetical protein